MPTDPSPEEAWALSPALRRIAADPSTRTDFAPVLHAAASALTELRGRLDERDALLRRLTIDTIGVDEIMAIRADARSLLAAASASTEQGEPREEADTCNAPGGKCVADEGEACGFGCSFVADRPGRWIEGVGWVALAADVHAHHAEFHPALTGPYVVVRRWSDGSVPGDPEAPAGEAPREDERGCSDDFCSECGSPLPEHRLMTLKRDGAPGEEELCTAAWHTTPSPAPVSVQGDGQRVTLVISRKAAEEWASNEPTITFGSQHEVTAAARLAVAGAPAVPGDGGREDEATEDERLTGAWVCKVTRFMPRCFVCGWDGPPMMRAEAEAAALGHNAIHHPAPATAPAVGPEQDAG